MLDLGDDVAIDSIRTHLKKLLASKVFVRSERLSRLLTFTVEHAIQGQGHKLKEYLLALEVFDRKPSFDPRTDTIVRVEARRLRTKMKQYYRTEGRNDTTLIQYRAGSYAPLFRTKAAPVSKMRPPGRSRVKALRGAATIAVLPFIDLSIFKNQEYLCDGIADELINALCKVDGLRVISRTSSFQFKGKAEDVRKIGQRLNAHRILEGSVRIVAGQLRIAATLVDTADGCHLWSATYERELSDAFVAQQEISREIVAGIKGLLSGDERCGAVSSYIQRLKARNLYQKGCYFWFKHSGEKFEKSKELFEQATRVDPNSAPAYSWLATSYCTLGFHDELPPGQAMSMGKAAAIKALEIDGDLAEAHAAMALVKAAYEWDWAAAEREFKRALDLNPLSPTIRALYATVYLLPTGTMDKAIEELKCAKEIDPLSFNVNFCLALALYMARQSDQAIEEAEGLVELDPYSSPAYLARGLAYEQKHLYTQAIAAFQKMNALSANSSLAIGSLGHCYASIGRVEEARELLTRLLGLAQQRYVSPIDIARIYIGLEEKEEALSWLEKAYEERCGRIIWLKCHPMFDTLRSSPRLGILERNLQLKP